MNLQKNQVAMNCVERSVVHWYQDLLELLTAVPRQYAIRNIDYQFLIACTLGKPKREKKGEIQAHLHTGCVRFTNHCIYHSHKGFLL